MHSFTVWPRVNVQQYHMHRRMRVGGPILERSGLQAWSKVAQHM